MEENPQGPKDLSRIGISIMIRESSPLTATWDPLGKALFGYVPSLVWERSFGPLFDSEAGVAAFGLASENVS